MDYVKFNDNLLAHDARIPLETLVRHANEPSELDLCRDGVRFIKNFLDANTLNLLNSELDALFCDLSFNKNVSASARIGKNLFEVTSPISIHSINLLELGVDIHNIIKSHGLGKDLILTNLEIFRELNNDKYLPFHTDERQGMYRAQIYLKGGGESSGGFKYIAGTHNLNHTVQHHLSREEVRKCKPFIYDLAGNPGDLIVFDSFGFHAKDACIWERRTIMFEFQERGSTYVKSSLKIDNRKLTPKVVDNFPLFMPGASNTYGNHGLDFLGNNYINFSMVLYVAKKYYLYIKARGVRAIKRVFKF